ncbi:hypothetical protein [Poseidonocella sp. HB161398]|uniref:hypothetical protein n=1 Tax=Poseidonocella sp. HB161398 TaxID=2320855 RepID=UPI0011086A2B|nr:hypothetical protein [Poseidonocella sp. HB161398]
MRYALIPALAVLALSACDIPQHPGGSQFLATNGNRVVPLEQPGTFEVIAQPGDAGPSFFCAAADYAYRRLGARQTDRVVIIQPAGDSISYPGTRGVSFALRSREEMPDMNSGLFLNPRQAGAATTVGHGRHVCNSDRNRGTFSR